MMSNPSASQTAVLRTDGLTKFFGGLCAVRDFDIEVPEGALYGLIGPNGAGKTTTLRMLAGLLEPSAGLLRINGRTANHVWRDLQRQMGYMPDFFGVYEDMLVWEYMDFFGRCYGLSAQRRRRVTDELLDLVDLTEKREAYIETLSRASNERALVEWRRRRALLMRGRAPGGAGLESWGTSRWCG